MDVPFWAWALTIAVILAMLAVDLVGHVRTPHAPSLREAATWSAVYVGIAVVFGLLVLWFAGPEYGGEYFAGYVTEKSLSVDNLFVFVLIMGSFAVPRELQQKVLLYGITFALVLRTAFILVGAAAIENFSWVFYVFGGFLVWTAVAQARSGSQQEHEFQENVVLRLTRKVLPTTEEYHSDRLTARLGGKRHITPLAVALIAIAAPTSCSRSTPSRRSSVSPRRPSWSSRRTRSRCSVCGSCSSCSTACSTGWSSCPTGWP
jgi:tellurite resistance protein TerC